MAKWRGLGRKRVTLWPLSGDALILSTRVESPLVVLVLILWESGRLPTFQRILLAHRREKNPAFGRCQEYATAFRNDSAVSSVQVDMLTADVGLIDPHWWIEHGGDALDVTYSKSHGLHVSVEDVAEFRERRNVRGV